MREHTDATDGGRRACRASTRRVPSSSRIQSAGATSMNSIDDAFTLPALMITSASAAGYAQPPRCTARIVSPTIHGSAAHASSSTEMRAVNASWYGVSM